VIYVPVSPSPSPLPSLSLFSFSFTFFLLLLLLYLRGAESGSLRGERVMGPEEDFLGREGMERAVCFSYMEGSIHRCTHVSSTFALVPNTVSLPLAHITFSVFVVSLTALT
jgi:hypothetical protein